MFKIFGASNTKIAADVYLISVESNILINKIVNETVRQLIETLLANSSSMCTAHLSIVEKINSVLILDFPHNTLPDVSVTVCAQLAAFATAAVCQLSL